jgi:hypothetical protein
MGMSEDQEDYIEQVLDRCRKLIHAGIWEGIQENRLNGWHGSLTNCDAGLLGAYLLDNLAFRSRDQYLSLLDAVFENLSLPVRGVSMPLLDLCRTRNSKVNERSIRIAPVIGHLAPPTKSGPYILRLAQRRYRIESEWLSWPQSLASTTGLSHIYLVDDFCGTGHQFTKFMGAINVAEILRVNPGVRFVYLVTAIHDDGLKKICTAYPQVEVFWGERLTSSNSVLLPAAFDRYRVPGFADLIRRQYQSAVQHTGLPATGQMADGFGSLGLAYGFAHATPNNTLPIFWKATSKLTALLDR